jgi:hypothetical protein
MRRSRTPAMLCDKKSKSMKRRCKVQAEGTVIFYEAFQDACNAMRDRRGLKEKSLRRRNRERRRKVQKGKERAGELGRETLDRGRTIGDSTTPSYSASSSTS